MVPLWNVHTESIDFYDGLKHLLQQKYEEFLQDSDCNDIDTKFQSHLFATFLLSSLKYILDSNKIYTAQNTWNELETFYHTMTTIPIHSNSNKP